MAYRAIPFTGGFLDENADPIAGAAPTITIRNSSGTAVITGAATTELTGEGGSYYTYLYTPVTSDTFTGVMSTASASATQQWLLVGTETSVDLDATVLTAQEVWEYNNRTLSASANVTIASFYNPERQLWELIIGDDYTTGNDNGALDISSDSFPILTGGSISVTGRHRDFADATFTIAGSVVDADTARLELTDTQTAAMLAGLYNVRWLATLADGTRRTLAVGTFEFRAAIPGGV